MCLKFQKDYLHRIKRLIEQTGGTAGVRDFNLLGSAIETPFQVFGGEELYPTIQAKGTCLAMV